MGEKIRVCQNNSIHTEKMDIPALNHNYGEWYQTQPIDSQPMQAKKCSLCNDVQTAYYSEYINPIIEYEDYNLLEIKDGRFVAYNNGNITIGDYRTYRQMSLDGIITNGAIAKDLYYATQVGDWIYYIETDPTRISTSPQPYISNLCRISIDGLQKEVLKENIHEFTLYDGKIYFADVSGNDTDDLVWWSLYQMDFDGTNLQAVIDNVTIVEASTEYLVSYVIESDYIYTSQITELDKNTYITKLIRYNIDGTNATLLQNINGRSFEFEFFDNGYLYYRFWQHHPKLCRISFDGLINEVIINSEYVLFGLTLKDGCIYYIQDVFIDDMWLAEICKINLDGTGFTPIHSFLYGNAESETGSEYIRDKLVIYGDDVYCTTSYTVDGHSSGTRLYKISCGESVLIYDNNGTEYVADWFIHEDKVHIVIYLWYN